MIYLKAVVIKKEDLKHNINQIKTYAKKHQKEAKKTQIIAVVKSNGYGLGLVEYTQFLIDQGINFFAVSTVEEAIQLRKNGIKQSILMLSSTCIEEEIELLLDHQIIVTIGSKEAAEQVSKVATQKQIIASAHIAVDTGFGRYGFLYQQKEELLSIAKK